MSLRPLRAENTLLRQTDRKLKRIDGLKIVFQSHPTLKVCSIMISLENSSAKF